MRIIAMFSFLLATSALASAGVPVKWNAPIMPDITSTYLAGNLNLSRDQKESVECLSKAIFFEARGESAYGKVQIANVVINRTKFGKPFASTICKVTHQRGQFDGVKESWKRHTKFERIAKKYDKNESESVKESLQIALFFVLFTPENTGNATHFSSNNYKFKDTIFLGKVGAHKFYQLKRS